MQVPFHNTYNNNQRFPRPNNFQWRPNFTPRGPPPRFRGLAPHWRQPSLQDHTNEFWCETCDRGFRTSDILEKHKQQHQKCNIDGCQFIAHPKVITKHIQMQHASGLYKKIAKLQDPEEIKKWREERKKKYPTKENVEKAAAAIKEKIDRGEKMGLKNYKHEKNINTGSDIENKRKLFDKRNPRASHFNQNFAPDSKRRKTTHRNTAKKLPEAEDTRKLKPFAGIQELMMDTDEQLNEPECGFTIEDEDEDEVAKAIVPTEAASAPVCLALSSLMFNYGSSDEDESDTTPTISTTSTTISTKRESDEKVLNQEANGIEIQPIKSAEKLTIVQINEGDEDSGPEEVKVIKLIINETEPTEIKPIIHKRKPKDNIRQKPIYNRPKPKVPSTLLQKLLFNEIKHERNIVLQCIRHIIKNNFFDKSVSN